MTTRILVTGGRDYTDIEHVEQTIIALSREFKGDVEFAHGGARGLDSLVGITCERAGIPFVIYPAEWRTRGIGAGLIRNIEMLDRFEPHILLSFPGGRGTAHCTAEAKKRGVEVRYV